MSVPFQYNTLAAAVIGLRERGFELDMLELIKNNDPGQFTIVEVHHFEGIINPADNSILYAIESKSGEKGIVVDTNGINAETNKTELLSKLRVATPVENNSEI